MCLNICNRLDFFGPVCFITVGGKKKKTTKTCPKYRLLDCVHKSIQHKTVKKQKNFCALALYLHVMYNS